MKSSIALAAAAIAAAIIGALSYQWLATQGHGHNDKPATSTLPAFSLADMHGNIRHSSEWNGKPRLINFWATWCPPCRNEIPLLMQAQADHSATGLQVIGIALEQPDTVLEYATDIGLNYPSLVGSNQVIELGNQLGNRIGALPYSVLVSANGEILERHMGELSAMQLADWLNTL